MLKKRASGGDVTQSLSAGAYLLCSAQASSQSLVDLTRPVVANRSLGSITAIMTNPFWLVRVRMFTTRPDSPSAYRGLWGTYIFTCFVQRQ